MTGRDAFKIWAPAGAKWVDWARPGPFAAMNDDHRQNPGGRFALPSILYITEPQENTAIVVDLPSYDGVEEGVALAGLGIRPIPLYNGTTTQEGAMPLVENHAIEAALLWGATELKKIPIAENAPPAFLLDSNRMHRYKMNVSVFDNSWDLYAQDIPSAEYFLANGIRKIIVRGSAIQKDLAKILYTFQKKGISILFTNGYDPTKKITLKKRPRKYE